MKRVDGGGLKSLAGVGQKVILVRFVFRFVLYLRANNVVHTAPSKVQIWKDFLPLNFQRPGKPPNDPYSVAYEFASYLLLIPGTKAQLKGTTEPEKVRFRPSSVNTQPQRRQSRDDHF